MHACIGDTYLDGALQILSQEEYAAGLSSPRILLYMESCVSAVISEDLQDVNR
jgi:hypothetical protein